jgi:alpha-L-arabinofuranosidase
MTKMDTAKQVKIVMIKSNSITGFLAALFLFAAPAVFAQATITVDADKPGHAVSPLLWGLFFEDINLSADGGIYPELVRNRSFEDAARPEYWKLLNAAAGNSELAVDSSRPLNPVNPHSLRVKVDGAFTLENEGYWGMNIIKGDSYALKFAARATDGFQGPVVVRLVNASGAELAKGKISGPSGDWKYHTLDLVASGSDPKAKLQISAAGKGTLFFDMVSLMPKKTWKGHGLRVDLAESIGALHPSFMRFPGGNWVEGDDRAHMYHWKNTIGDIDARTPLWNTWGYNTTQGLGFHEYLQLCEDLGAEPLLCINDGMSLHDSVPLEQMGPWVQDALDAIEYANGPTNSFWGSLRAKAGHPAPFHLRYMEIGNENGGPDYHQRWPLLVNAIREKYPSMQLIVNTDLRGRPYPREPKPDIVDEHYYESPESFMWRAGQYDSYDRNGPKIFIGEYAVTENAGKGNLRAAVGEAAFMTGLERNSDIVIMASYAPLFVNLNHRAWNPDLINFNGSSWYGLPGYYVQQMFGENRGDVMLPISVDAPPADPGAQSGAIGVGTWRTQAEFKDIKVTAPDGQVLFTSDFSTNSDGWKLSGGDWQVIGNALRQNSGNENVRALAGDKSWTDYSLTLKARKLGGNEGFLVLFHMNDDRTKNWWNIGGWGNTANGIELGNNIVTRTPGSIETNRWYDIRVDVRTNHIQCYLDGRLVHDVDYQPLKSLFASATHDRKTGDIILKVVNAANFPVSTDIHLRGAKNLYGLAKAIVLASSSPRDENSLAEPAKVSPKTDTFNFQGDDLHRTFPGNSVTVLRLAGK